MANRRAKPDRESDGACMSHLQAEDGATSYSGSMVWRLTGRYHSRQTVRQNWRGRRHTRTATRNRWRFTFLTFRATMPSSRRRLDLATPRRLPARSRRERVDRALPGCEPLRVLGEAIAVEPIHQTDHLDQLFRQRSQLRAGADVHPPPGVPLLHRLLELT